MNMTVSAEYRFNDAGELMEVLVLNRGITLGEGTMKECPWFVIETFRKEIKDY